MAYDPEHYKLNKAQYTERAAAQWAKMTPEKKAAERDRLRAYSALPEVREARNARNRAKYAASPELKKKQSDYQFRYRSTPEGAAKRRSWRGIKDPERFDELFAAQGNKCGICKGLQPNGGHGNKFHADHDHKTGYMRGVLCGLCNSAIGYLRDSPENCIAAADYLRRASTIPEQGAIIERKRDAR